MPSGVRTPTNCAPSLTPTIGLSSRSRTASACSSVESRSMAAPRSPVATPSSGSRWLRSSLVTVSRRSPRGGAHEVGDEVVGRVAEQLGRRPELREPAALGEDGDLVAHLHGLVDVVGDQDDGLVELVLEPQELVLQPRPDDRVDGRERLVHQQHRRVGGQRPRDADPLLLAPGELVRVAVGVHVGVESDQGEQLARPLARLAFGVPISEGTVATLVAIFWWGNSPICWIT